MSSWRADGQPHLYLFSLLLTCCFNCCVDTQTHWSADTFRVRYRLCVLCPFTVDIRGVAPRYEHARTEKVRLCTFSISIVTAIAAAHLGQACNLHNTQHRLCLLCAMCHSLQLTAATSLTQSTTVAVALSVPNFGAVCSFGLTACGHRQKLPSYYAFISCKGGKECVIY